MLKRFKFIMIITIAGIVSSLSYFEITSNHSFEDWVGSYETTKINKAERKYLFKKHHIKEAYFTSAGSRSILLNSDFTFNSIRVAGNNDTIYYNGKWELINEKPLLHFLNKQYYLNQLPLTGKVYYYEKVKTCEGDTINHLAVFKKIK